MSRRSTTMMMIGVMLLVSACAKKPATIGASAPAPSGQVSSTTVRPVAESRSEAGRATPTVRSDGRPQIQDFVATPNLVDIYFDFDKYDIRPDAAKVLDANAV